MKAINKTLYIAALGLASLSFVSCNNDEFLEVPHYDILPADAMSQDEDAAISGLNGIYDMHFQDGTYADSWNYKPQLFLGCHPTLDTQATGWDVNWNVQNWNEDEQELAKGWIYCYRAIGRCNDFLAVVEGNETAMKWKSYKYLIGEAHANRAYFYMFLAQNWGRVPMLATGENYSNAPQKARAETDDEVWDFIIDDLKAASENLEWKPFRDEYGRCTKGMALSYLGEAYLWKAYKARVNGDGDAKSKENIQLAKQALEQVMNSGTYELVPSYTTLWDVDEAWPKEAVWQVVMDMGKGNYGQWNTDAHIFNNFFAASTNGGGGWGSQYMSWELYFLFEKGDKRRDASMCTSPVQELPEDYRSAVGYGYHPYLQQWLGRKENKKDAELNGNNGFMFNNGEFAPAVWTMKLWRCQRAQWSNPHSPCHFYYKRYSGVLLDYAECLFRLNGGNDTQAWSIIDQIRNRAFGNLEVGQGDAIAQKFVTYYNSLAGMGGYDDYVAPGTYPFPMNDAVVSVEPAKEYYTNFCNNGLYITLNGKQEQLCLPFTGKAEPWEVALGQERRKEFNSEWNLKADLQRSEFLQTHIECDYPKGRGLPGTDLNKKDDWHYYRTWDFNPQKLLMPIPLEEINKNSLMTQNPGY
ncbi:MAG: RagB/SusD family nutrient uptake outer membrane protein [Prevotella sp.]